MTEQEIKKLRKEKQRVIEVLPPLDEIMRGTFIKCYLECIRANCKCHKGKRYRHGPYYRVSYGKAGRMHHVYVPIRMKNQVKKWTENYIKLWEAIEKISEFNIQIIRLKKRCLRK
ncbi:MAG: DUF6788 family protein [Candidatus Ratteibacteria bacterium]